MVKNNKKQKSNIIATNKKARFDYFIEQILEVGISLHGWEVKSLRSHRVDIKSSYVILKNNEMFLFGSNIMALKSVSTHVIADPVRMRKLLLHRIQINRIRDKINQKGVTIVPIKLYWLKNRVKLEIGIAKGKKLYDKVQHIKDRDWQITRQRILKLNN